jgi:hypothetical protein
MRFVRAHVLVCAAALAVCQVGLLATASVALCHTAEDGEADDETCACGHGPGAMCPMHGKNRQKPQPLHPLDPDASGARGCKACINPLLAIHAFGEPGPLKGPQVVEVPFSRPLPAIDAAERVTSIAARPDSPPPRS